MKKLITIALLLITTQVFADAICNDGTTSTGNGSGTCSHHGGVYQWLPPRR